MVMACLPDGISSDIGFRSTVSWAHWVSTMISFLLIGPTARRPESDCVEFLFALDRAFRQVFNVLFRGNDEALLEDLGALRAFGDDVTCPIDGDLLAIGARRPSGCHSGTERPQTRQLRPKPEPLTRLTLSYPSRTPCRKWNVFGVFPPEPALNK